MTQCTKYIAPLVGKAFTFTGHIHTEVDAIDWIHVDCARLHKHGCVSLSAFSSC